MDCESRSEKYCIVGAGASGLAVARNFAQHGVPFDCLEREDDVGGNWNYGKRASSVYRSTHLISSKRLIQYPDFPMPSDWPDYPGHRLVLEYFQSYARKFDLYPRIEFNAAVTRIEPTESQWQVTLQDGRARRYRGVVIANGHHWDPKWPEYPGKFSGPTYHSSQYKTPDVLDGRRVLVIGAGNSGCDIAVESAQHAARTFHSTRRGYHYIPKFLFGRPADLCGEYLLKMRIPLWLRRLVSRGLVKMAIGTPQDYGLTRPDHQLFESHPIINSQMMYYVGHGDIHPKPDIARFDDRTVHFTDGTSEPIDVIVFATGFKISFPFIDTKHLNWHDGRPKLYLNAFHPHYDHLFVAGLVQPDGGIWDLSYYQGKLMAEFIRAMDAGSPRAEYFRRQKATASPDLGGGIHYVDSTRHLIEVEHFSYRRRLQKLIARMSSMNDEGALSVDRRVAGNTPGVEQLQFRSGGVACEAWLIRPHARQQATPLVLMAHGFAAEKSFGLLPYAEQFVRRGMAAMLFDYRHFGGSGGEPRNLVSCRRQREDWQAALDFARNLPGIDAARIALWGTSFSGGHVIDCASRNPDIAAVVAQEPMVDVPGSLRGYTAWYFCRAIWHGLRDVLRAATNRAPHCVPVVGPPSKFAVLNREGCDEGYRRMIPDEAAWANSCPARILLASLLHRPIARAAKVNAPTLLVIAEQDQLIPARTVRKTAERMTNATVVTVPGDHFAIYFGETLQQVALQEADFLEGCLLKSQTLRFTDADSPTRVARKRAA
jgi:cation diffusion facilitator CzcD-associated flavoprotein CzcO/dienelactone hydrolase